MKSIRILSLVLALVPAVIPTGARADDAQDWTAFGHVLTLLQTAMRIGAC